jgi:cytochrome c-type biogenesis protein CcmH/NrfF
MKSKLLWLIVAVAIILGYALYLSRTSRGHSEIDPHARQEIEKAKHR